jgi:manganese/zinc/iron transport system permease protein
MGCLEFFTDHTFRTVLIGTTAVGATSGAVGCFAYLRRQSLVGDVISHSSLFGVMLFFLLSYWLTGEGSKSLFVLIPGAMVAGIAALLLSQTIVTKTSVREDSGLGVMLAIFFGTGILLLRWVQKASPPIPGRRGLQDYLFGMAASMTQSDLMMIGIVAVAMFGTIVWLWKELKVFTFDPMLTQCLGFRTRWLNVLMIVMLVSGIVIGIQSIGVVLMISMLVTPAAAARQWTNSLGKMVILASFIGALCGLTGTIASALTSNLPTGPVIVLSGVAVFGISIVFSPSRGILVTWLKQRPVDALKRTAVRGGKPR